MVSFARTARYTLFTALLTLGQAQAASGAFTAAVDRTELYQNEHVVLTLALTDSDTRLRAEGMQPNIDLTVLTDQFELGVPRADFRFNLAREERRSTSELTVELFPRRSGRLSIPAFAVDGLRTQAIVLRVLPLPADARSEVFARSGVAQDTLPVGAQTLLYLDLYYRADLAQAEFGAALETEPLQIEVHALPNTERSEKVDGLDYNVTRSAWAVSPQSVAPVTLRLPALWIETRAGKRWRLPGQAQHLRVLPPPVALPPGTLAARPALRQSAFGPATAGRMVPWQITVQAAVGLNSLPGQLPFAPAADAFRLYFDPPERRLEVQADGGVDSIAVYTGYLMPLAAGTFTAPALELPYFDAGRGTVEHAVLPDQTLRVAPAERAAEPPAIPSPAIVSPAPDRTAIRDDPAVLPVWPIIAVVCLAAWLATLALWWRQSASRRGRGSKSAAATVDSRDHPLKRRLLAALGGARTLEQGLRAWEDRHGADEEVRAAVRTVQRLCYRRGTITGDNETRDTVDRALAGMSKKPPRADSPPDPWSPQSFSTSATRRVRP